MEERKFEETEFPEPSPEIKKYMAEEGLKRKTAHFGKLFHWLTDSGVLEILRPKAIKLILMLIRHADFVTGNGRVGNKKIAKKCGIYKGSVSEYFKEVNFFGVIKTWREGRVRYYHINNSPPPDIKTKVDFYRKPDKSPRNTDTYHRDQKGRFIRKETLPKNSDMAYPKNTEPA